MTRFNMTYCFDIIASYLFLTLAIVSIFIAPILIIFLIKKMNNLSFIYNGEEIPVRASLGLKEYKKVLLLYI